MLGEDPYQYDKLKLLEQTRPARMEMRAEYNRMVMKKALQGLPHHLDRVWRDPTRSTEQRKDVLFALWDECADNQGGRSARAAIEHFVAIELPVGSRNEFSVADLSRYNAERESREAFAPYRPLVGPSLPGDRLLGQEGSATVTAVR
jgi:hypothetical protein